MKEKKDLMPEIEECEAEDCSFNANGNCHAIAINVGGIGDECPSCDTYINVVDKGGIQNVIAGVGACKVQDCTHNKMLECTAKSVSIKLHAQHADCATYKNL